MTSDLTVILEDRPGTLSDVGEALGKAGINIDGLCGFPVEGKGCLHLLVEDAANARSALKSVGIEVRETSDKFWSWKLRTARGHSEMLVVVLPMPR